MLQTYTKGYNCTKGGQFTPMHDPDVYARVKAAHNTPEMKKQKSEKSLAGWANAEVRKRRLDGAAVGHARPESKKKKSQNSQNMWRQEGYASRRSAVFDAKFEDKIADLPEEEKARLRKKRAQRKKAEQKYEAKRAPRRVCV